MADDVLGMVLPDLPPGLVEPTSVAAVAAAGSAAPTFAAVGFECRLAADVRELDLQLGTRRDECVSVVRSLARMREQNRLSAPWERVFELCREWTTPGTRLHGGAAELWCELDMDAAKPGSAPPALAELVPSVFIALAPGGEDERSLAAESVVGHLVTGDAAAHASATLARCADACPTGAWVSHVGVMLGRNDGALRVHVSDVPLVEVEPFLHRIGWPGDVAEAAAAARLLLDHGDSLVICFDVAGTMLPRIGLECFFAQKRGIDPRWSPLLDRLVDEGLVSGERAAALLRWPGVLTPADTPWPDVLLARSVMQPGRSFGVVERRLSHVKLALGRDEPASAKAYFGAGHIWLRAGADAPLQRRPPALRAAPSVADAIDRGVAFLLRSRNQGGWWRDFYDRGRPADADGRITGYASDEWVTAYVGAMLATIDREEARVAAADALALLLARARPGAGWGYHALLPADADTTTWVLRLADAVDSGSTTRLVRARSFVAGLAGPAGGIATYPPDAAAQLATFLKMPGPYDGWCAEHACVTAAAAMLDLGPGPTAFLARAQRADGGWSGHWWDDDEYTTLRAAETLSRYPATGPAVRHAAEWAAFRLGDGRTAPTPFATALSLHTVLVGGVRGHEASIARAVRLLLSAQREDGSWEPSSRLRVPAPAAVHPLAHSASTRNYVDDEGFFTTATVLAALGGVDAE